MILGAIWPRHDRERDRVHPERAGLGRGVAERLAPGLRLRPPGLQVAVQSDGATVDPGDELGLIYERTTIPPATYDITTINRDVSDNLTLTLSTTHLYQAGDLVYMPTGAGLTGPLGIRKILSTPAANQILVIDSGGVESGAVTGKGVQTAGLGFLDNVIDALVGASLYTNASQEGILQANNAPPMVLGDVAEFRRCAFYGYARERQAYDFRFISIGSPSGVQAGDYVEATSTDVGVTLRPDRWERGASRLLVQGLHDRDACREHREHRAVVRSHGRRGRRLHRPVHVGSDRRSRFGDDHEDGTSRRGVHRHVLRPSSVITFGKSTSEASTFKGRVYYSKVDQPEAVPSLNFVDVGGSDAEILRLIPLRDALIVLKNGRNLPDHGRRAVELPRGPVRPDREVPRALHRGDDREHRDGFDRPGRRAHQRYWRRRRRRPIEDKILPLSRLVDAPVAESVRFRGRLRLGAQVHPLAPVHPGLHEREPGLRL